MSASGPERLGLVYMLKGRYEAAVPIVRIACVQKPEVRAVSAVSPKPKSLLAPRP